jgi:hypothetical protein
MLEITRRQFAQFAASGVLGARAGGVATNAEQPRPRASAQAQPVRRVDFNELCRGFAHPIRQARSRVVYCIPRGEWDIDALIKDLQHMKDAGFGGGWYHDGYEGFGPVFGDLSYFPRKDAAPFMSPEHLRKVNRFLEEAYKRDLQMTAPIRAMYMSGGPWINADHALKEYTLSKIYVTGPGKKRVELPQPACRKEEPSRRKDYYRDALVVAWPVKADPRRTAMFRHRPVITVNQPDSHEERAFMADGNPVSAMRRRGVWLLPYGPRPHVLPKETVITYEFDAPIEAATCFVKLAPDKSVFPVRGSISCSNDGTTYRKLTDFDVVLGSERRIRLNNAKARWFRVTFPPLTNRESIGVAEIEFLAPGEEPVARERIRNFNQKAARGCWDQSLATKRRDYFGSRVFYEPYDRLGTAEAIRRKDVRDLTSRLDSAGFLEWDVPEGLWCVMRLGYTLAQNCYVPARPGGAGYECDIYSAEAARIQYEHVPRRILQALSPEGRKGLQGFWFTGFEAGPTNWTPRLAEEFRKYAGYEITSWLPALADEVVESTEETDAFLADFRRTLHHLFAENHHGVMKRLCERDGLKWFSKTGVSKQTNQDDLLYLSRAHVPGGESPAARPGPYIGHDEWVSQPFGAGPVKGDGPWWTSDAQTKLPASASHIYGNSQIVAGSASGGADHDCQCVPAFDKHVVDRAFCSGTNQLYSGWAHDSREGVYPGLHHWPWLDPRNTIFWQAAAFFQYVSRCQSLLQQGVFQADVLIGQESAFHLIGRAADQEWPKAYVPKGYDFDFISRELLLQDLQVKEGALRLSSGMRYRLLQMPDFANRLTLQGLRKIEQLLRDGAVISAPKPVASMTVLDYADGLAEHRKLADRIWAGLEGQKATAKQYGKGRLYWGASLEDVLAKEGIRPDFAYESPNGPAYVDHIHRWIEQEDIDIYFLANAVNRATEIRARFRGQKDKIPYLFDPLSGEIRRVLRYAPAAEYVEVPLRLEPVGSLFVVFVKGSDAVRIAEAVETSPLETPTLALEFVKGSEGDGVMALLHRNGTYQIKTGAGATTEMTIDTVPAPIVLQGPWKVEFRDMFGESFSREFRELKSFHLMEDERVRYFSGDAAYHNHFELPAGATKNARLYLDCGKVCWLAEVHVNGRKAGVVWCPPWRLEITPYCRAGENNVKIVCVNPWKNRLIGDARLPEKERKTVLTSFRMKITADMELMEAGLLGLVQIVPALLKELRF